MLVNLKFTALSQLLNSTDAKPDARNKMLQVDEVKVNIEGIYEQVNRDKLRIKELELIEKKNVEEIQKLKDKVSIVDREVKKVREDLKREEERKDKDQDEGFGKIHETLILSPGNKLVNLVAKTHQLQDNLGFIY
jgi:hypothetical protein